MESVFEPIGAATIAFRPVSVKFFCEEAEASSGFCAIDFWTLSAGTFQRPKLVMYPNPVKTGAASEPNSAIRQAVESMLGDFTARDVHDRCPHASIDLVRDVLGAMRKEGLVVSLGKGRGAKWRRAAPFEGTP